MLETGLNVPFASSRPAFCLIRWQRPWDSCADQAIFEGQGAMELEALAGSWRPSQLTRHTTSRSPREPAGELLYLDPSPMWEGLLEDLAGQTTVARMAGRFHYGLAKAIREMVARPGHGHN